MTAADPQITWPAPFWPDDPPPADTLWPSERHPWSDQMVVHYLRQLSQPGDWVLDPFASQAALVRAASAERRRLVLNNASQAALLGVLASAAPPPAAVVDHAFSRIADAPRRGRTLAHHLAALYETICPECAQTIVAARFVWDRTVGEPVEKSYRCPHCAREGDAPADMGDVARVAALEVRGAAYWGLLSRLVKPGDVLTAQARSLQDLYPPRALLVISELLTAAEQRLNDSEELRAARALILHVLVAGLASVKMGASNEAARPQLPRRFVENNLWLAFEHAHRTLRSRPHGKAPLLVAAEMARLRAPEGEGRVLPSMLPTPELAEQFGPGSAALILTEPPPFDPTSYALQFLWSGWLYGREAANRQRPALSVDEHGVAHPARIAPGGWSPGAGLRRQLTAPWAGSVGRRQRGRLALGGPGYADSVARGWWPHPVALRAGAGPIAVIGRSRQLGRSSAAQRPGGHPATHRGAR